MTHPRVSTDTQGCASLDSGYVNTEIKASRLDGTQTVSVLPVTSGELTSNNVFNTRTIWTMKSDGSERKKISLPQGYRYSDVYPFLDGSGNQKIIISAEKIGEICNPWPLV